MKKRREQIKELKKMRDLSLAARRQRYVVQENNPRKSELIKLRNEIMSYTDSIDKQESLRRLEKLERQCDTLSETEFQKRLRMVRPTIIVLYER